MIKSILSIFFAVTLSLVISIVIFPAYPVMAQATIYVPDDHATIQEAIDAALTGDTVYVRSGTYNEYLSIDKSLTLEGEDRDTTIIQALSVPPAINIQGTSNVIINNLTIKNDGREGVYIRNSSDISLVNNNISGHFFECVKVESSTDISIVGNSINASTRTGMTLISTNDSNFSNNMIFNNGQHGIYLSSSNGNTFTGNTISNNGIGPWGGYGIFVVLSEDNEVYNNNFIDNQRQAGTSFDCSGTVFNLDAPIGGNYWNNWITPDVDPVDGFVDQPYYIGGGFWDNLPWTQQDGWLQNQPPDEITVLIDIKPGSDPNSINLGAKGVVPVAVLTTADFDATTVKPDTVVFASAEPQRWTAEDVDGDGDLDLLFHFKTQELDLTESSTEATLTGQTLDDDDIAGADSVRIVPSKNKK